MHTTNLQGRAHCGYSLMHTTRQDHQSSHGYPILSSSHELNGVRTPDSWEFALQILWWAKRCLAWEKISQEMLCSNSINCHRRLWASGYSSQFLKQNRMMAHSVFESSSGPPISKTNLDACILDSNAECWTNTLPTKNTLVPCDSNIWNPSLNVTLCYWHVHTQTKIQKHWTTVATHTKMVRWIYSIHSAIEIAWLHALRSNQVHSCQPCDIIPILPISRSTNYTLLQVLGGY